MFGVYVCAIVILALYMECLVVTHTLPRVSLYMVCSETNVQRILVGSVVLGSVVRFVCCLFLHVALHGIHEMIRCPPTRIVVL